MFGKPVDENRAKIVGLNFLHYKTNSNVLKNKSMSYRFEVNKVGGKCVYASDCTNINCQNGICTGASIF
jgi:hypothetical protein